MKVPYSVDPQHYDNRKHWEHQKVELTLVQLEDNEGQCSCRSFHEDV